MSGKRRKYTASFGSRRPRLVIETGRPGGAHAVAEIGVAEQMLGRWVRLQRQAAAGDTGALLDADERAELERLRREKAELRLDREFLKKGAPSRCGQLQADRDQLIAAGQTVCADLCRSVPFRGANPAGSQEVLAFDVAEQLVHFGGVFGLVLRARACRRANARIRHDRRGYQWGHVIPQSLSGYPSRDSTPWAARLPGTDLAHMCGGRKGADGEERYRGVRPDRAVHALAGALTGTVVAVAGDGSQDDPQVSGASVSGGYPSRRGTPDRRAESRDGLSDWLIQGIDVAADRAASGPDQGLAGWRRYFPVRTIPAAGAVSGGDDLCRDLRDESLYERQENPSSLELGYPTCPYN